MPGEVYPAVLARGEDVILRRAAAKKLCTPPEPPKCGYQFAVQWNLTMPASVLLRRTQSFRRNKSGVWRPTRSQPVDLILTDPPYKLNVYSNGEHEAGARRSTPWAASFQHKRGLRLCN